ncbi:MULTISPECIES: hypothetical protein [Candidatus Nitrosocaldus]|jgi:uncharacterized protein YoxC|uniref:DUF8196 domain-containing protein n=1 Tax=Candidatus Nitrosocaldus cavascurensis TaxID=2058097 RepID=A0A2K5ARB4_9ARCH|nr:MULTISPECIES: hypothetical protein [Candidatus Nitrosocaldus]SPC34186.1 conserved protein of unknown function [Candidatus Nitrosocaldus cavascurensis]
MLSNEELKKKLLDMLEKDKEFRHAVAGAIGYKEILDRIARVEEEMSKRFLELEADMNKRFAKVDERFATMQEEMNKRFLELEERIVKVEEEIRDLRRETNALREETNRLRQDMIEGFRRHDEEFKRVWESIENLRRDMQEGFKRIDKRLRSIETYMERTSLTLEEEARDVIEHILKGKGLTLSLSRLELPDIEIDIYGVDTEYCIIGEVKTRASPNVIERVDKDIATLCSRYPQYIREKVIKVIYAMQVTQVAVEEARKSNIWLVTAKGELTEFKVTSR